MMKPDRKGGVTMTAGGTHIKFPVQNPSPPKTKVMSTKKPSFIYPSTAKVK